MLMQNTEGAAVVIIWGVLISTIDNTIIFSVEMCACVCVCVMLTCYPGKDTNPIIVDCITQSVLTISGMILLWHWSMPLTTLQ